MSDQPPLTPPSPPSPGFEPYQAPAYGDVAPDAPTQAAPVPPGPSAPAAYPVAPYPAPPTPYQVAPQYVVHHGVPNHPLATTSLVLGIVGLVGLVLTPFLYITFFAVTCSPFAIWLGARARRQIRANPQVHGGEGLATAGFITGIIGVVLGVVAVVLIVAVIALVIAALSGSGA